MRVISATKVLCSAVLFVSGSVERNPFIEEVQSVLLHYKKRKACLGCVGRPKDHNGKESSKNGKIKKTRDNKPKCGIINIQEPMSTPPELTGIFQETIFSDSPTFFKYLTGEYGSCTKAKDCGTRMGSDACIGHLCGRLGYEVCYELNSKTKLKEFTLTKHAKLTKFIKDQLLPASRNKKQTLIRFEIQPDHSFMILLLGNGNAVLIHQSVCKFSMRNWLFNSEKEDSTCKHTSPYFKFDDSAKKAFANARDQYGLGVQIPVDKLVVALDNLGIVLFGWSDPETYPPCDDLKGPLDQAAVKVVEFFGGPVVNGDLLSKRIFFGVEGPEKGVEIGVEGPGIGIHIYEDRKKSDFEFSNAIEPKEPLFQRDHPAVHVAATAISEKRLEFLALKSLGGIAGIEFFLRRCMHEVSIYDDTFLGKVLSFLRSYHSSEAAARAARRAAEAAARAPVTL